MRIEEEENLKFSGTKVKLIFFNFNFNSMQ